MPVYRRRDESVSETDDPTNHTFSITQLHRAVIRFSHSEGAANLSKMIEHLKLGVCVCPSRGL